MGQRSQIYVKVDGELAVANYYQWNYGTRMISRTRYGMEWIQEMLKYPYALKRNGYNFERFRRIWDVNFDYHDIVISDDIFAAWEEDKEYFDNFYNYCYLQQDVNDGKLFIDVNTNDKIIKFTLTDNNLTVLTPDQYMDWNKAGWRDDNYEYIDFEEKEQCYKNIKEINKIGVQMTQAELDEFITH